MRFASAEEKRAEGHEPALRLVPVEPATVDAKELCGFPREFAPAGREPFDPLFPFGARPMHVLALFSHIGHTTIAYDLTERLATATDATVTAVSVFDRSRESIDVPIDDAVTVVALGARSRVDPRAVACLRVLLASGRYDVLHTHHNFVGSLGRLLAPRDLAIVDTEHADHRAHYSLAQNLVNAPTLPRADRVVANSEQTLRSFYRAERWLLRDERLRVIYNGIDTDRIDRALVTSATPFAIDGRRIVTVGRLIGTKDQATLLRAFAALSARQPDVRLTIVGDGPLRTRLEALAADLSISERVEFTGTIEREAVYRMLAASDVFTLPSRSEGFCVAAVEAMACGLPVVASDIPVLHEVIGPVGTFAPVGDAAAFADRLNSLLVDDDARRTAATRLRTRARTRFPLERTVEEYYALYEQLLAERRAAAASS
ncbi:glycosyltransferase [Halalkalicoccus subterraneus]|uniref:glycosyltransferase n=1 Tax=Halalkalicoccus subterraneus TaxID=2675002 RepID=UPI001B87E5F6|nr:glycosyltransferase [Halalkalicoccus subterraneus]